MLFGIFYGVSSDFLGRRPHPADPKFFTLFMEIGFFRETTHVLSFFEVTDHSSGSCCGSIGSVAKLSKSYSSAEVYCGTIEHLLIIERGNQEPIVLHGCLLELAHLVSERDNDIFHCARRSICQAAQVCGQMLVMVLLNLS